MSRGTDIAAQSLGMAAAAANAIPIAGQFASIGLGLASAFTKMFGNIQGPRKKRRARASQQRQEIEQQRQQLTRQSSQAPGAGGQLVTGGQFPTQAGTTAPVMPAAPSVFNPFSPSESL